MFKVLFITPSYKPAYIYGGPIYSTAGLAEALVTAGICVDVYTTNANGSNDLNDINDKIIDGVRVKYFIRQTKDHSHFSIGLFYHLWNNFKRYDSIHIHSWWNFVSLISLLILKVKGVKNITLSPRGMLSPYTINSSIVKKIFHYLIGNFLLKGIKIHATSNDEFNKLYELNNKYKIFIIPNIIQINKEDFDKNWNEEQLNILYLSRVHPKKNIETILYALAEFKFKYVFNIVGDGEVNYINRLKKLTSSLKIEKNVNWLGSKYKNDKNEYFKNSSLFVLASKDENFANVVLESLSFKTPVIISQEVGLADFVQKYNLGWICNDSKSILNVLNDIVRNKSILINKSNNCIDAVLDEFDASKLAIDYINLYQKY